MNELQTVTIAGTERPLMAVEVDGKPHVSLRHACEALGVDFSSQSVKLRGKSWACVVIITTQLPGDTQRREVSMIDRRTLTMWLATIDENRVAEHVRPTLIAYQAEAADALEAHFHSTPAAAPLTEDEIVHQALQITARKVEELEARVEQLEPPAKAWEDLASAAGDYSLGDAAKVLKRAGITTGQNRLFSTLGELGWTFRRSGYWQAMQTAVDQGLVVERIRPPRYDQLTGQQIAVAPQIRLTAKGIEKLRTRLGGTPGGALVAVQA